MNSTNPSVVDRPHTVSAWQANTSAALLIILVIGNALRVAFHFGFNRASFNILDGNHVACCSSFIDEFLILISLGLIVSAAGVWTRSKKGSAVSLIALLFALLSYSGWYLSTRSIMRKSDVETFGQLPNQTQSLLTLIDATWWDVIALAIVLLMILWHLPNLRSLRFAFKRLRPVNTPSDSFHGRDESQRIPNVTG